MCCVRCKGGGSGHMESKAPNFFGGRRNLFYQTNLCCTALCACVCAFKRPFVRSSTLHAHAHNSVDYCIIISQTRIPLLYIYYYFIVPAFVLYLFFSHFPFTQSTSFLIQFKFHIIAIYYEFAFPPTLLIHPNRPHAVTRAANPILFIVGIRCYQPTQTRTRATDRRKGKAAAGFD